MATLDNTDELRPLSVSPVYTAVLTALGLAAVTYAALFYSEAVLRLQAKIFMVAWLALFLACTIFLAPRNFTAGFLTGLLAMLIQVLMMVLLLTFTWRGAGRFSLDYVLTTRGWIPAGFRPLVAQAA